MISQDALKDAIVDYLNVEAYSLEELAKWTKTVQVPTGVEQAKSFKQQLRVALDTPGMVTPALYEKWTGEDMDDQDAVQQRLQEIWDACFGEGL